MKNSIKWMNIKSFAIITFLILYMLGAPNEAKGSPNASFTHIYFLQGDGSVIDLINGGVARVYVDQPTNVNLTTNLVDSVAHYYTKYNSVISSGYSGVFGYIWNKGISPVGTYTDHVELWWWDGVNYGTSVLQDSKDITIVVSQRPPPPLIYYYDLSVKLTDQVGRPIFGATVSVEGVGTQTSSSDGSVSFVGVPAGTYTMTAMWQGRFNPVPVIVASSSIALDKTMDTKVPATIYDAELQLVSPSGKPLANVEVALAGVSLGITGADGKVTATQVASWYMPGVQPYPVTATWMGVDVSPDPVTITASQMYTLTAKNIATLTVQVVGAQGQALNAPLVEIANSAGIAVFSGVANEKGITSVEVPYGTYDISANYKGFTNTASASVSSPTGTVSTLSTNVFIEVLGQAMTFATFVLWIIVIIIVVLVLAVVVHEYHVWRRKRLPQLFGAPRVPGA
jgi:hypothetical protein